MNQLEKIKAQSSSSFSKLGEAMNPKNQKFFPFWFSNTFYAKTDKLVCDFCGGQDFFGNDAGYYSTDLVITAKGAGPLVCCSARRCPQKPANMWEYENQVHGQPKPLTIPEDAPLDWDMVYSRWFRHYTAKYAVMKYNQITFNDFRRICNPSEYEGGTFRNGFVWYNGHELAYSASPTKGDQTAVILSLTNAEIIRIINVMLAGERFVQLKLF